MINEVILRNFKCYKKQPFELSNLTVFCGNNSSGKSTVIQSLLLILQNNFSTDLELTGDYVQPGNYNDIHNRNADEDSLSILIDTSVGVVSWGYSEDEFSSEKRKEVEEAPLPLLNYSDEAVRYKLRELYKDEFVYLHAERWGPRSNYPYSTQRRSPNWLGVNGEYAPQVLEFLVKNIQTMSHEDARIHPNLANSSAAGVVQNLFEWMGEVSPGVFIKAQALKNADITTNQYTFDGESYRAINVGFGLSYVLPIVLALLVTKPGGLVIIENPEAHLHPKGQSYLGRLIQRTAEAGVQVIIETHSDHLLNGIRVAARLSENYIAGSSRVFFVSPGEDQSNVEPIDIGDKGELSNWPSGFFDQQAEDIRTLMKGVDR
ncbi:DUF3696 domain-containing protein [Vibrio parahaemolyticus]|uniref:DUF3696 domain-containing protein n=3 Tax=Vibrio parahaemolyticus TaxID=670 RepID=UPI0012FAF857|nr:DUF3696 domain-containing protein [Vibrio parahaemolyticus]EHK7404746.1 DUF3696 domain-containing protein [Vibrio parahaemolyticus]EKQ5901681.1 DUF3696 domain-containing protein [Vibrio parahaemolyticus]ELA8135961.1 DUF3696 domain-containing protein [Vibrio parahaemolyticus]MBE3932612.1 DUF3696 domain-containing protein [Vibrio parahaemolyticus]MBE4042987.1 DUF3696 domain-containing protein [Vibrio parahaemolyticus]